MAYRHIDSSSRHESHEDLSLDLNDTATTSTPTFFAKFKIISIFAYSASWASGELQLQISEDGANWTNQGSQFSGDGVQTFVDVGGRYCRVKVAVAAGSASTVDIRTTVK